MYSTPDEVRRHALEALAIEFARQGHPQEYAVQMASAVIFQTDLELRNAQLTGLLGWLQQKYPEVHTEAVAVVEQTREQFEHRVQAG